MLLVCWCRFHWEQFNCVASFCSLAVLDWFPFLDGNGSNPALVNLWNKYCITIFCLWIVKLPIFHLWMKVTKCTDKVLLWRLTSKAGGEIMFLPHKVFRTRYLARLTQTNYIVHLIWKCLVQCLIHMYVASHSCARQYLNFCVQL